MGKPKKSRPTEVLGGRKSGPERGPGWLEDERTNKGKAWLGETIIKAF